MEKTLKELAEILGGQVIGDGDIRITGIAALDDAGEGDLTFLANPKYTSKVATTKASAVILPTGADPCGKAGIVVANPHLAFAKVLTQFHGAPPEPKGVMEGSHIGHRVVMGTDATNISRCIYRRQCQDRRQGHSLSRGCFIRRGGTGNDVTLHSHVSIRERCRIGNRVTVHSGAVIGTDGFGYAPDGAGWYKIPQLGIVVIEDDVEIGANTTIDRSALDVTRIGRGTKIDNLVMIAHNCVIGENCMIISQVGIAGSTRIGNHVTLAGQVGVAGHLEIGDNVMVGAKSGVTGNIAAGSMLSGIPVIPHRDWLKASVVYPRLPELRKTVTALEKKIQDLEDKLAQKG